jgi:HK97 family phage prohead protease
MHEQRIIAADVRCAMTGKAMRVSGIAARYNSPTRIGAARGAFIERIARGAFSRAIDAKQDTAFLINHDVNRLMARVSSGTLRLRDGEEGLEFEADLPDTEDARNAYAAIQRGDMHQCSFRWTGQDDDWDMIEDPDDRSAKIPRRTLRDIKNLEDVSAVTFPAYQNTEVHARAEQRSDIVIPEQFVVVPAPVQDAADIVARRRELLGLASL